VLSKVDLMDEGTDVVDILAGRIIPLRLGYVPVGSLIPVCLVVLEEVLLVLQGISNEFLVLNITLVRRIWHGN
jgi:hypothetical protein